MGGNLLAEEIPEERAASELVGVVIFAGVPALFVVVIVPLFRWAALVGSVVLGYALFDNGTHWSIFWGSCAVGAWVWLMGQIIALSDRRYQLQARR